MTEAPEQPKTKKKKPPKPFKQPGTLVLLGGGLDSCALLHFTRQNRNVVALMIGDVSGSRRLAAEDLCDLLDVPFYYVNPSFETFCSRSPYHSDDPEHADAGLTPFVFPTEPKPLVIAALAAEVAERAGCDTVAVGVTADDGGCDSDGWPVEFMNDAIRAATECAVSFVAPFRNMERAQVICWADRAGVDLSKSVSCRSLQSIAPPGDVNHCGNCCECFLRAEAFDIADVTDATRYADSPHAENPLQADGGD